MKHNKFNLSHDLKLSFEGGKLIPILVQEVLPGDKFKIDPHVFLRTQPMIAPVMHNSDVFTYFYYVQNGNIWNDANEFYTRGRDMDSTVTIPRVPMTNASKSGYAKGSLPDYMGIPPHEPQTGTVSGTHYFNALPFRAYQNIYQEHFRNQEWIDEVEFLKDSADIVDGSAEHSNLVTMQRRAWPKDYFINSKAQAVLVPEVNGWVPAEPISDEASMYKSITRIMDDDKVSPWTTGSAVKSNAGNAYFTDNAGDISLWNLELGSQPDDYLGIGIDIDNIRRVSALQRWVEAMIRTGYRYPDYLKAVWQVRSKDARLDRPEYLGGASIPIRISEVLNTSATATEAQGEMAGHGVASGNGRAIRKEFTEHGWVIGLICVLPKASYFQGLNKFWTKFDHLDYANPMLANLGRQYITTDELYVDYTESQTANQVNFALTERYQEYKQNLDRVSGEFRDTLSFWTMAREFTARPVMSAGFINALPPTSVFASSEDPYLAQIHFNMSVLRKLPVYANLKID